MSWFLLALATLFAPTASAVEFTEPQKPLVIQHDDARPPLPADWQTVRGPYVAVHGAPDATEMLLELSRHAERRLPELARSLGVPLGGEIHLYVADSQERFRSLQPAKAPLWADGVAYPGYGMVLLREPDIRGGMARPLTTVLDHELVHILLGRAFAPAHPPTWLQEGLAQVWAKEVGPETTQTLANGLATGQTLSLDGLSRGFPSDPVRARVAYAQSADFIGWMQQTYGERSVRILIDELAQQTPIEGAIHAATGDFLGPVERAWQTRLTSSGLALGFLANMDGLLGIGAIALVIGGIARRRRFHERLAEMEAEENALDELIASYLHERRAS